MWTLVVLIVISGVVELVNIEGFHSKEDCKAAVVQIKKFTQEKTPLFVCQPTKR